MSDIFVRLFTDYLVDTRVQAAGSEARDFYVMALLVAKQWSTDGVITRGHLPMIPHENPERAAARLVELGLMEVVPQGWRITSWLKYNISTAQMKENKRNGGLASSAARSTRADLNRDEQASTEVNRTQQKSTDANSSVSVSDSVSVPVSVSALALAVAVEGGSGGNGAAPSVTVPVAEVEPPAAAPGPEPDAPADQFQGIPGWEPPETPAGQPEFNDGEYEPTDPEYAFDPRWDAEDLLVLWEERLGRIQPIHRAKAGWVLQRLHNRQRLSKRQLRAMVQHCISDRKARKFWGTGRSPAIWLDAKGSERVWQRVMAHLVDSGWSLPVAEPEPVRVIQTGPPRPPKPPRDPSCTCRHGAGWENAAKGIPCPTCELGKWNAAHEVPANREVGT